MKLPLILALSALPLLSAWAQAQDPDVPLIDDLSPARKAQAETRQAPRSPKQPAEGAAKDSKPGIPGDSDRPEEPILREMPKDLSAAVSRALQRNPQVQIADAKLRQAQAELNEAKFKLVSKVTAAFRDYAHSKKMLADVQNPNSASDDLRRQIRQEIEASELDLIYLLGIGAESSTSSPEQGGLRADENQYAWSLGLQMRSQPGMTPAGPAASKKQEASRKRQNAARGPAIPKALRGLLAKKMSLDFEQTTLGDCLDYVAEAGGVQFMKNQCQSDQPVTCHLQDVTVGAALQAIADLTDHCFIFRDYGILVMERSSSFEYMQNDVPMIAPGGRSPLTDEADGEPEAADRGR